jgi:hypothetical protein
MVFFKPGDDPNMGQSQRPAALENQAKSGTLLCRRGRRVFLSDCRK